MDSIEKIEKIIEDKETEIEELKEKLQKEKEKKITNEANELMNEYRDKMLEIIELGKKQNQLIDDIYYEVYNENSEKCKVCSDFYTWENVFEHLCPFAFICGLKHDSSITYLLDNEYEKDKTTEELIKNKVYTSEDIKEVI